MEALPNVISDKLARKGKIIFDAFKKVYSDSIYYAYLPNREKIRIVGLIEWDDNGIWRFLGLKNESLYVLDREIESRWIDHEPTITEFGFEWDTRKVATGEDLSDDNFSIHSIVNHQTEIDNSYYATHHGYKLFSSIWVFDEPFEKKEYCAHRTLNN